MRITKGSARTKKNLEAVDKVKDPSGHECHVEKSIFALAGPEKVRSGFPVLFSVVAVKIGVTSPSIRIKLTNNVGASTSKSS